MKTAIITGASGGIGQAVAERMLAEGWTVGLIARRTDRLESMANAHSAAIALPCDVTDPDAVESAFASFAAQAGRLDVLFNNAGIFTPPAPIDEIPVSDWLDAVNVNLTGMFLCARAAFGQMRHQTQQGGRIINNGSVSATSPRDGSATYTTTKHGVTGLTKTLALDGRAFNIACGQIDIGNTRTDMVSELVKRDIASGNPPPETFDLGIASDAIFRMADLPAEANVLFQTIMATKMPFVGRG